VAATVVQAADLDYTDPNKEIHEFFMKLFTKRVTVINLRSKTNKSNY
jgi:hypothetical protein